MGFSDKPMLDKPVVTVCVHFNAMIATITEGIASNTSVHVCACRLTLVTNPSLVPIITPAERERVWGEQEHVLIMQAGTCTSLHCNVTIVKNCTHLQTPGLVHVP